ncbi:MAG: ABC transporter ATP-binding protein [Bacteroidetes bacterium]|nr:ABC transporter ATP-binding protein [Bacteroidota bacterium]
MNNLSPTPLLRLDKISRKFSTFGLKDICFSINRSDYFMLLGVSGAGKSVLLEIIAGLVTPDSGTIQLGGNDITHTKIQHRKIGLVFQDHAIFPHMTVYENIAYPLHGLVKNAKEKKEIISDIASKLGITGLLDRKPSRLSGGELQRVSLARALVQKPEILLLDEPLASLDSLLKSELRSLLRQLNRWGQTIIHVTHDYEEAISLGNIIAVMHKGEILQSGTPSEVFSHPKSQFVAHFTGARNFYRVKRSDEGNEALINETILIKLPASEGNRDGFILVRSEDIFLSKDPVETSAVNNFKGVILEIVPTRSGIEIVADIGIPIYSVITQESLQNMGLKEGQSCFIHFKASAVRFIPG